MASDANTSADPRMHGFIAAIDDDTDFTVTVGDGAYSWRIHAELAAKHSTFFKTMIEASLSRSTPSSPQGAEDQSASGTNRIHANIGQEARKQAINMQEDNPWMVARMLQFFYRGVYDFDQEPTSRGAFTAPSFTRQKAVDGHLTGFEIAAAMYVVADKYGAADLKAHALRDLVILRPSGKVLVKICQSNFRDLIEGNGDLKLAIAQKIATCYAPLRKEESEWLQTWITTDPEFALLIMDSMNSSKQSTASSFAATKPASAFSSPAHGGFGFGGQPARSTTPEEPFRGFAGVPGFGAFGGFDASTSTPSSQG
ncbi:hypothetical protein OHC33_004467 [Knufia fluminis]|uniref:BTB domain-containing protein n=1 Tax=Knufia fluminis TaxID=191047 RepID=A0AAN8EMJ6_9EURO|nr:hypothetical protein OHC33_004467 [Knufia fluminis]